jgi:hypothetical protein
MKILPLVVALLTAGFNQPVQAAVELAPVRVEEIRNVIFKDDKVSRMPPSLKVILAVTGPEAESCVSYGDLKLEEAMDDKGASLIPAKDDFHNAAKFKDYENAFFRKSNFGDKSQPAAPQVEIGLAPPKRAATRIARLRGSFSIADQGKIQTIELPALKGAGPKTLPIPASAHLGITATVEAGDNIRSVGLEITGDESALESIEVIDASGQKVSSGTSSWSFNGGPAHKSISLAKPLDNSMKLVAKVALDRKIIKVPFDLKDIALP